MEGESACQKELLKACQRGDAQSVKHLLDVRADVNTNGGSVSALMMAAFGGHLEVVTMLLEARATVDAADDQDGWTPLIFASRKVNPRVEGLGVRP